MKINGLKKHALWENIKCCCIQGDIEHSYPLLKCDSCKFTECWQSVPQKDFKINDDKYDKSGKVIKKQTRIVKEITLVRGSFDDIIGWEF